MNKTLPTLAVALLGLGWSLSAQAEEATSATTHPADSTQVYRSANTFDPFSLAVPLLDRAVPAPSYAGSAPSSAQPSSSEEDAVPGMDHSAMPGMDHSNMPGMSGN